MMMYITVLYRVKSYTVVSLGTAVKVENLKGC